MTKVYLAHSISTAGEYNDSKRVANEIRALGYEVYAAAENDSINDKSNDPTPIDIYNGDVSEIMDADIFVVNLSGGHQDGTISEIGVVAGLNEIVENINESFDVMGADIVPIVAYTSNARLLQPQQYRGMSSASANHLVLGMIDRWGEFVGSEQNMIKKLEDMGLDVTRQKERRFFAESGREPWELRRKDLLVINDMYDSIQDIYDGIYIFESGFDLDESDLETLVKRGNVKVACFAEDRKDVDNE